MKDMEIYASVLICVGTDHRASLPPSHQHTLQQIRQQNHQLSRQLTLQLTLQLNHRLNHQRNHQQNRPQLLQRSHQLNHQVIRQLGHQQDRPHDHQPHPRQGLGFVVCFCKNFGCFLNVLQIWVFCERDFCKRFDSVCACRCCYGVVGVLVEEMTKIGLL